MTVDSGAISSVEALATSRVVDRHGDPVSDLEDRHVTAVELVTALVKGYTRGAGFDANGVPAPDLRAVIAAASLRFLNNTAGLAYETGAQGSRHYGATDNTGLTLLERQVCNRYRVMAR